MKNIAKELRYKNHHVIEFDAWKNDYTKEPLLAFMSEINNSLETFFTNRQSKGKKLCTIIKKNGLPILMSILSKRLTGYTLDEFILNGNEDNKQKNEEMNSEKANIEDGVSQLMSKLTTYALEEHNTIKNSINTFKINMRKLLKYIEELKNQKLPLFILIDELDRCRPNYAIQLLENIKHLFDIEGIIFIIATDSKQLSYSINAVYGERFSSQKYLKRFFDQEYCLITPDNFIYINSLFEINKLKNDTIFYTPFLDNGFENKCKHVTLMNMFATITNLNLRDINHVVTILKAIRLNWQYNINIQLPYLLLLIFLKVVDDESFQNYKRNKDFSQIKHIFQKSRNNLVYETRIWQDHWSSTFKEKNFLDLIEYYDDISKIKIDDIKTNKTNCEVNRQVNNHYLLNINSSNQNKKYSKLTNYFDLVLYAGQVN